MMILVVMEEINVWLEYEIDNGYEVKLDDEDQCDDDTVNMVVIEIS